MCAGLINIYLNSRCSELIQNSQTVNSTPLRFCLPVSVLIVSSLPVYDHLPRHVLPHLGGVDVGDEHVLQAQVEALVLGVVGQEEEGPETQRDEGTEDEEQDELLGEPQRGAMVREGGGPR